MLMALVNQAFNVQQIGGLVGTGSTNVGTN